MALTADDVARLASLARIDLTDDELARLAPQLDIILDSISHVTQVTSADIPATSHAIEMTNVFRDDQVSPSWPAQQMLANAPQCEDQQFVAPRILNEEA